MLNEVAGVALLQWDWCPHKKIERRMGGSGREILRNWTHSTVRTGKLGGWTFRSELMLHFLVQNLQGRPAGWKLMQDF